MGARAVSARPRRTVRRVSTVTYRGRPLVLIVPPTCDVLMVREKGRRTAFEVDILTVYQAAARIAGAKLRAERAAKRKRGVG